MKLVLYHVNANVNLIIINVTQMKTGITIYFGVSTKNNKENFIRWKKIIFEMLLHLLVNTLSI